MIFTYAESSMERQRFSEYSCDVQDKVYSLQCSVARYQIYRGERPYACETNSLLERAYSVIMSICSHLAVSKNQVNL